MTNILQQAVSGTACSGFILFQKSNQRTQGNIIKYVLEIKGQCRNVSHWALLNNLRPLVKQIRTAKHNATSCIMITW